MWIDKEQKKKKLKRKRETQRHLMCWFAHSVIHVNVALVWDMFGVCVRERERERDPSLLVASLTCKLTKYEFVHGNMPLWT